MTALKVLAFTVTFLGFVYSVIALMSPLKTDATVGMLIATAGIIGWAITGTE